MLAAPRGPGPSGGRRRAALLAPLSMVGAILHIAAHAVGKITLFFAAGAIYTAAHKTEISQLDGIGRYMPWTMGAFAIASLSMIGLPPAVGFVSKWYMLSGAMAQQHWLAVGVIVAIFRKIVTSTRASEPVAVH